MGKHTKQELLFFATIFHDLGKLKNFQNLMKEVEEREVKGISRFIFHANYGKFYFTDELKAIEDETEHYREKLEKEDNETMKKFYTQAIEYMTELKNQLESRENFFKKLQFSSEELKYIAELISEHMNMLNIFNVFEDAYLDKDPKKAQKRWRQFKRT